MPVFFHHNKIVQFIFANRKSNFNANRMNESTLHSEQTTKADCLISQSYTDFHSAIYNFIKYRINNDEDAADLAQDTYLRLLDYKPMLRPETVKSFIFTIARNLVIDYIRRHYRKQEVSANMYEFSKEYVDSVESQLNANDLLQLEHGMMMKLPKQRKLIYYMDRFEDKSADEISNELQISKRTVESHLFSSRKVVREYIRQCI